MNFLTQFFASIRVFRGQTKSAITQARAQGSPSPLGYLFSGARTFLSAAASGRQYGLDSPPPFRVPRCCGQECPRSALNTYGALARCDEGPGGVSRFNGFPRFLTNCLNLKNA